jgi:hypothetical protein
MREEKPREKGREENRTEEKRSAEVHTEIGRNT